jgi:UDP-2,4-diacetamido-2,4,6-trideoxy-beta-L-altropyranose hydrolase
MKIAFRVDATNKIGTGHLMRCLALAEVLKAYSCAIHFLSRNLPKYLQQLIGAKGYTLHNLESSYQFNDVDQPKTNAHSHWLGVSQEQDALESIESLSKLLMEGQHWDWLVVDHYGIDDKWEASVKQVVNKILVIDDLADRHHNCNILVDQNLYKDINTRYSGKVQKDCTLLLGPKYSMLRREFIEQRKKIQPKNGKIQNILVYFGGVDINNDCSDALEVLAGIDSHLLHINVVIGRQHPATKKIQNLCRKNCFQLHIQTNKMAKLMADADFAIGAGGISTYERLYLRLPALLKATSANQTKPLLFMKQMGLFDLYSNSKELKTKLEKTLAIENTSPIDCVMDGNKNIINRMFLNEVALRGPEPFDVKRTYHWLQKKSLRRDFMISKPPVLSRHFEYWRSMLGDSEQKVYSMIYSGKHIGNCGLKNIDPVKRSSELWVYVAEEEYRGKGIAKSGVIELLSRAKNELLHNTVHLHVNLANTDAVALYQKTGFFVVDEPLEKTWISKDCHIVRMECIL